MSGEIKSIRNWLIERGYNPDIAIAHGGEPLHDLLWAFYCHLEEESYGRRKRSEI